MSVHSADKMWKRLPPLFPSRTVHAIGAIGIDDARPSDPHPSMDVESFGISTNGTRMTVGIQVIDNSLVIADHVPGIRPPPRQVN